MQIIFLSFYYTKPFDQMNILIESFKNYEHVIIS
jgi:hypothetical protein